MSWSETRRRVIERDSYRCRICGRQAKRVYRRGDTADNQVTICGRCLILVSFLPDADVARVLWLPRTEVRFVRRETRRLLRELLPLPPKRKPPSFPEHRGETYQKYVHLLKEEANWSCSNCGWQAVNPLDRVNILAHHPDPGKLYEVVIVCADCHSRMFHQWESGADHLERRW